ncbi:MAG: hypothetical protein AAGC85_21785 [Bacteroidota bacterium]
MAQYINPYSVFKLDPGKNYITPKFNELRKIRKRNLAELDLQEGPTVSIKGFTFDRNTLDQYFEELEKEGVLSHHLTIWKNRPLHKFLEEGNTSIFHDDLQPLTENPGLHEFIAPYFIEQYGKLLMEAVRDRKASDVDLLVKQELPFDPEMRAKAYEKAYKFLNYQLKDAQNVQRKIDTAESYRQILPILPAFFDGIRHAYKPYLQEEEPLFSSEEEKEEAKKWGVGVAIGVALAGLLYLILK